MNLIGNLLQIAENIIEGHPKISQVLLVEFETMFLSGDRRILMISSTS